MKNVISGTGFIASSTGEWNSCDCGNGEIGRAESANLLRQRIQRVLTIAQAYQYDSLVLGAWGCGEFANDPLQTATDFRSALEGNFAGAFSRVFFAIVDWSDERRFLRPFCAVFSNDQRSV
jgi:uncharacterized protein (TIGR02452 family)